MHFVYIIYSRSVDVYYKGYSTNLEIRLQQHNSDESRFTGGKGPWTLVYFEQFESKADALKREKVLKKLNRTSILKLIGSMAG